MNFYDVINKLPPGPILEDYPKAQWTGWTIYNSSGEDPETGEWHSGIEYFMNRLYMMVSENMGFACSCTIPVEDILSNPDHIADFAEINYDSAVASFRDRVAEYAG